MCLKKRPIFTSLRMYCTNNIGANQANRKSAQQIKMLFEGPNSYQTMCCDTDFGVRPTYYRIPQYEEIAKQVNDQNTGAFSAHTEPNPKEHAITTRWGKVVGCDVDDEEETRRV
ncbi:hypothetical protein Lal_00001154 [Lupinus albus]|nr:hypothetical protein Lal_00001154 [Lupinus albus]